jgi:hypothetical protein
VKQTARLITTASFQNNEVTVFGKTYPCFLSNHIQHLHATKSIDLAKDQLMILVPNTLGNKEDQEPYLGWTIIGIPKDQEINPDDIDIVRIFGKVINENVRYNFILVKLQKGRNDQKLKLNGVLDGSIQFDSWGRKRGSAVDRYFEIVADVVDNELVIVSSKESVREYSTIPVPISE